MVLLLCLVSVSTADSGTHMALVVLAFLARMFIFSGSAITWIWTAEVLSTEIRSTGHSIANAAARIGGFVTPYLVSKSTPLQVIGITMWSVSLFLVAVARQLPETNGTPMGRALENDTVSTGRPEYRRVNSAGSSSVEMRRDGLAHLHHVD